MLDKTLPYFNVIMKRHAGIPITNFALPPYYFYDEFREGFEQEWADIVTSVGEFEAVKDAMSYFTTTYGPFIDELKGRVVLVRDKSGNACGTVIAGWNFTGDRRDPSIHWLAVKEEHQGKGIGRALVSICLERLLEFEGELPIFLHTQTWSHKAIRTYRKAGFQIEEHESFGNYPNDYELAMKVLRAAKLYP